MKGSELNKISNRIRSNVVQMSHRSGAPHLGSSLSCVDLLVSAYWKILNISPDTAQSLERDRFILSKGHAAAALYATLAERGFFSQEKLLDFCKPGNNLPEQPSPDCAPGVEWATGSLGHGLPVGLGMALAAKITSKKYRVLCLLSDGECNEGSVWEAALSAPAHKLGNLAVIIDFNKWQATGRSQEVTALDSLVEKWRSFGWQSKEVDGHDHQSIIDCFDNWGGGDTPLAVVAHTIKGKGISFMEDDNNWHYRIPTSEEVEKARQELIPR